MTQRLAPDPTHPRLSPTVDPPGRWPPHLAPRAPPRGWAPHGGPSGPAVPRCPPPRGTGSWTQARQCSPGAGGRRELSSSGVWASPGTLPPSIPGSLPRPWALTPPQLRVRAKSLPVPRGRMATGGGGFKRSWSSVERIQPTWRSRAERARSVRARSVRAPRRPSLSGREDSPCRHPRRPGSAGCALGDTSPAWGQRVGTGSEGSGPVSCAQRARQASSRHRPHRALAGTYASLGPPWLRSKTCRGFRYQRKDWMILAPCGRPGADREAGRQSGWWAEVGRSAWAQEEARCGGRRDFLRIPGRKGWGQSQPGNTCWGEGLS